MKHCIEFGDVIGSIEKRRKYNDLEALKNTFLTRQSSKRTNICNRQRHEKLIVVAERAQKQPAVFETDAAAAAIVACLYNFILEYMLDRVVGN